jgi:hypothetical protein
MAWLAGEKHLNLSNIYGLEKFDNYEMNQEGVLINVKTKRILKGSIGEDEYTRFELNQDGLKKNVLKHRLIAELWIFNPDNLACVDHIDRNRLNNAVDNLRWCSYEENSRNQSKPKNNSSGEMNIHKCFNHGHPRWVVLFGRHTAGNEHRKYFPRDPDSDIIPEEVKQYRDAYSLKWKGQFCPLDK